MAEPALLVELRNVTFSYGERVILRDVSLQVPRGKVTALMGASGGGKTTLVNLIMRFYDIDSGTIRLDGIDTAEMSRHELRSQVGMVLQDAVLFGGTIRENIGYGRLDATDEEVVAAAQATYVDRFVRALPDGYDTVIEQDAANVSAGERQLITIARAFLADPRILILDEATSALDSISEGQIRDAIQRLSAGRTTVVIAHRLSTIRDADTILVMSGGRIIEQGSHDELMSRPGAYRALYESQFSEEPPEEPEALTGSLDQL